MKKRDLPGVSSMEVKDFSICVAPVIDERIRNIVFYLHPEATVLTDLNGVIIDCNEAYLNLCKCHSINEILGKPASNFINESDFLRIIETLKDNEGEVRNIEITFSDVNGRRFPAEVSANLLRDSSGEVIGIILSIRDISERKKLLETLVREKKMFDALMDSIPDAIYFKDVNSRFIRINRPKAVRLGLKDPEEAVGKTDFDFYNENFAREAYEDEQRIMRKEWEISDKV